MHDDKRWMARALALARRGKTLVYPNPKVGCVLVREGKVIGEGYHHRYGAAHAEVEAIENARGRRGEGAKGSILYVNLEPCSHWGKTPPCAEAVIRAGVKRVVAAMKDPNPLVSGKGFALLKKHGIKVTVGVLKKEAGHLNHAFIARMKKRRPYITLKVASSLDGRTATVTGESKWITSDKSRKAGHQLRAKVDAIAVGSGTILKDNPSLTAHGLGRNPIRIVFAGRRSLPRSANVFRGAAPTQVLKNVRGKQGLHKAMANLAKTGIAHLLVEGGLTLQTSFLEAGLVDEVIWFVAPIIIGNNKRLKDAWRLKGVEDVCVRASLAR